MNYLKQIVVAFVVIAVMVIAVRIQISINEAHERNNELREKRDELQYENERLKNELEQDISDDEYIEQIASEQLDYKDPNAQYFYNDLPN